VIDFGVAKAIRKLTESTLFTGFRGDHRHAQYMSPEQAELNQLDVDTRSDIYGLGVLLRAAHGHDADPARADQALREPRDPADDP
jgi:serine/threonine protein kinase